MMTTINYEFPIICLSETWLGVTNCHLANTPSYNHEYSIRNARIGGGVSIFIHSNISNYSVRRDISIVNSHIESIFIEIDQSFISADRNIVVGCIYRPAKQSVIDFNETLKSTLDRLSNENKHVYLAGDYNINLLTANSHLSCSDFVDVLFANSFLPTINKPTRITGSSATIIDNIFINNLTRASTTSGILANSISDHCPVFCFTPFHNNKSNRNNFITKRLFTDRNKNEFHDLISSTQ
jgi:exonuclease III